MNERISKLVTATDAWCDQNLPSNWTDDVDKYLPVWNEKFAELIVQECIEQIYPQWLKDHPLWIGDTDLPDAVSRVKEHFGVEE
ncbi:hypothetical protein EBT31_23450 [bacterium]|nr:hypothetical protein [bacterium]